MRLFFRVLKKEIMPQQWLQLWCLGGLGILSRWPLGHTRALKSPWDIPSLLLFLVHDAPIFGHKWWCPLLTTSYVSVTKGSWKPLHMLSRETYRILHHEKPCNDGALGPGTSMAGFPLIRIYCNFGRCLFIGCIEFFV